MTPERAREIWESQGIFGSLKGITEAEDNYIREVWETLPGFLSYAHALLWIMYGHARDGCGWYDHKCAERHRRST